ncbi:MAG: PIN domain-containing protein [Opitutales bacterium]|nr:PIN domain-containing protein [Opitutales bacterium]MCH8541565.1 PIN domain-containing protein [Opitutales bacterium]
MTEMTLVDTSAWIEYFRRDGDADVRAAVAKLIQNDRAAWSEIIFLELLRGNDRQRKQAKQITETLPCLSWNTACWQRAYQLARLAARAGKPVPNTDILIFACARQHGAGLLHRDRHFDVLAKVSKVE